MPANFTARAMFLSRPLNVEREVSSDCASPMSAKISSKIGRRLPSRAGTGKPLWFIAAKSAIVLSATVFPPALGPEIIKIRLPSIKRTSTGTATSPKSGCRAPKSNSGSSCVLCAKTAPCASPHFAAASAQSNSCITVSDWLKTVQKGRSSAHKTLKILRISAFKSYSACTSSFEQRTESSGSIKTVIPL